MREVIATGKTVEEATENGCLELGLGRDEVSVEILEMPVSKLFKKTPAKVKVTAEGGEDTAPPAKEKAPAAAPKASAAAPASPAPAPAAAAKPRPTEKQAPGPLLPVEPEEPIDLDSNPRAAQAVAYLASILGAMGAGDVQLSATKQGDATLIRVEGDSVAERMDIKGEVIQALSYLVDRSVNAGVDKKEDDYLRIRLDIAGYRNRREAELQALAERTAAEVARTGRSRTLAPMNPYERLIVHTAVSQMEGVMSESIGADVERRVVVKSTGPNATDGEDWRPPRKGGGGNRGRDSRGPRNDRGPRDNRGGDRRDSRGPRGDRPRTDRGDRGPSMPRSSTPEREYADKPRDPNAAPVVPAPREAVSDGDDLPLYGKIEL